MVHQEIYNHCIKELSGYNISFCARKNEETPFGYVIDYIKDMFNMSKTEGWDTAKEVCKYFGLV